MLPCVILAGGLGTRLGPLTQALPKALIPVAGRPFAELQLEWLASEGVTEVLMSVGHLGHQIRDVLGDGARFGLHVSYSDEGEQLRGTGGALLYAAEKDVLPSAFFLLNCDSYLSLNLADVEDEWHQSRLPALMTVYRNENQWDRSNAQFEGGLVYYNKDRRDSEACEWIDYGLSILTRQSVVAWTPHSEPPDVAELMHWLSEQHLLAGYAAKHRFYEVGSPAGLRELQDLLS